MPYYTSLPTFDREFKKLTAEEKLAFMATVRKLIQSLSSGQGIPGLPLIRKLSGYNLYELRWAADGRATFEYAYDSTLQANKVIWRRVGDHSVLNNP